MARLGLMEKLPTVVALERLLEPIEVALSDPPGGAGGADEAGAFALDVTQDIVEAQRVWDFFRDKLLLRSSPRYRDGLWMADTIAWSAYRPVIERAVQLEILVADELREPPLTYLTAEPSPATWVRRSRPNDGRDYELGQAKLPIPVIAIPWEHLENPWELLSILHEVGHDIEADLGLRPALRQSINKALTDASVPEDRKKRWLAWQGELFADLVALELGGPAYARTLMHLLLLPKKEVQTFDDTDPHPLPYLRILVNAMYIRTLTRKKSDDAVPQAVLADADAIESEWKELYGEPASSKPFLETDAPLVLKAMMDTPFEVLADKNKTPPEPKTVRDLVRFTVQIDAVVRKWAAYIATGQNQPSDEIKEPRHLVSAARIAVSSVEPSNMAALSGIRERVEKLVRAKGSTGPRGGGARKSFIESFAKFFRDEDGQAPTAAPGSPVPRRLRRFPISPLDPRLRPPILHLPPDPAKPPITIQPVSPTDNLPISPQPSDPPVLHGGEHGPIDFVPQPRTKKPLPARSVTDARWSINADRSGGSSLMITCSWGVWTHDGLRMKQPNQRERSPDNPKATRWRDMPVPRKRSEVDGRALSDLLPHEMVTVPNAQGGPWRLFLSAEGSLTDDIVWEWALIKAGGDPPSPVALNSNVRFARSVSPRYPISSIAVTGPLRVLVVPGSKGFVGEAGALQTMLEAQSGYSVSVTGASSRRQLGAALERSSPHVIHYVGASALDHGEGCLILGGGDGPSEWLRATDLAAILPATTRLLCLTSAAGRNARGAVGLAKIALAPVEVRLPTTLASQYVSSPEGADAFWTTFYQGFSSHYDAVEAAHAARRGAAAAAPDTADFASQTLVVRDGSGVGFTEVSAGMRVSNPVAEQRVRLANMLASRAQGLPPAAAQRLIDAADDEWSETP